jgi:hypothetical protein
MKRVKKLFASPFAFLAVLILAALPFFYVVLNFFSEMGELDEIAITIEQLRLKQERVKGRGQSEQSFLAKMKSADHFYIDKNLETLLFLEEEIAQMEAQTDPGMKKHLETLKSSANKLLFSEEEIRRGDLFQEVEEKMQHPVEMNEEDLKKLLCLIEEVPIPPYTPLPNAPQLLIKNFELSRKILLPDQEVYQIDMQLIKREGK